MENPAGEARSTADLVVRPPGAAPGSYFHITKVTQGKQTRGEEFSCNQSVTIDPPPLVSELQYDGTEGQQSPLPYSP